MRNSVIQAASDVDVKPVTGDSLVMLVAVVEHTAPQLLKSGKSDTENVM